MQVEYNAGELDALALLFTAVKVLYLGGALTRAARLIKVLEPARQASCRPLHQTLIRSAPRVAQQRLNLHAMSSQEGVMTNIAVSS